MEEGGIRGMAKPYAAAPTSQSPVAQTALPAAHVQPTTAVSAKKKTEEQGLGPLLRHLFTARAGNT